MRYYLDTNVLIYVLMQNGYDISRDVQSILDDYSNRFCVSSVSVQELVYVYKAGKIQDIRCKSVRDLFDTMDRLGIDIVPMNKCHLLQYATLEVADGHKDPNDHIIIAQAISDKIPIISSDGMFKEYTRQGLEFVFNKR